jgi:acid phosphatase class B
MRRAVICVTAALAAVAIGFGLNSATSRSTTEISVSTPTTTPTISIWEIHNQAHLEFLPVQQIEDQTFVFVAEEPR